MVAQFRHECVLMLYSEERLVPGMLIIDDAICGRAEPSGEKRAGFRAWTRSRFAQCPTMEANFCTGTVLNGPGFMLS